MENAENKNGQDDSPATNHDEKEMFNRLKIFSTCLVKNFEKKVENYYDVGLGKTEKLSKSAKILGAAAPVFGVAGKAIGKAGELASNHYYKDKAIKIVKNKFYEDPKKIREALVTAAVSIFASYESQFATISEKINLEEISIDAVERHFNYYDGSEDMSGEPADVITKGIVHGRSKELVKKLPLKVHEVNNISVADLFEKVGIVTLTPNGDPENYYKRKGGSTKHGYRLLLDWESENTYKDVLLSNTYELEEDAKTSHYKYVLKFKSLKKYAEEILKKINENDPELRSKRMSADIAEIKKNLQTKNREEPRKKKLWFRVKESVVAFTGRQEEQIIIAEEIGGKVVVVHGLPGVGKSELAIRYARTHYGDNDSVVWINASTKITATESFSSLYSSLGCKKWKEDEDELVLSEIIQNVYEFLDGERILLIFDNAEKFIEIKMFLPHGLISNITKFRVLLTSTNTGEWENSRIDWKLLPLKDFEDDEAKGFIVERLGLKEEECSDAVDLSRKLCNFPLALLQAICYIEESRRKLKNVNKNYNIKDYLKVYDKKEEELLLYDEFQKLKSDYGKTTFTALKISLDKIVEHDKKVKEILEFMSYLASDNIPPEIFSKIVGDDIKLGEIIGLLKQYSIVKQEGDSLEIHGLIQRVCKLELKQNEEEILRKILSIMGDYIDLRNFGKMLPHVVSVWDHGHRYPKLIQEFVENCKTDTESYTIPNLHLICRGSNYKIVEDIFSKIEDNKLKEILDLRDNLNSRRKPVHYVAVNGDTKLLQLLIAKGADTQYKARRIKSPLHFAAQHGNLQMVEALTEVNKIDDETEYKYTPLHFAAKNGHSQIVRFLLRKGADVNACDKRHFTALHHAVKSNHLETVNVLLDKEIRKQEIDVDAKTELGKTPLHIASRNGYLDVVEILLQRGACVKIANNDGFTPLHYAAFYNHLDIVKLFLEEPVDGLVDCVTSKGKTALDLAIEKGNAEIVQILKLKEVGYDEDEIEGSGATLDNMGFNKRPGTSGMGGQLCEIELLMFCLLDGTIKKEKGAIKSFFIASNMEEASDFDDVVYKYDYEENGKLKTKIIFLQAKHKEPEAKDSKVAKKGKGVKDAEDEKVVKVPKIAKDTLLSTNTSGDFVLRKYLSSYWKILQQFETKKEPVFCNSVNDCEFILYTNAEYAFASKNDVVIKVDVTQDDLLNLKTKYYYKLNAMNDQVLKVLENPLDYEMLVRELCQSVVKTKNIDFRKVVIKDFQSVLTGKIVEKVNRDDVKLKNSFLDGEPDHEFTDSFLKEVKKDEKYCSKADDVLKEDLKEIKIKLHPSFWDDSKYPLRLPLPPKEFKPTDILKFAENLKIFSDQLNEKELAVEIKKRLQEAFDVQQQDIDSVYSEFLSKVTNWWREDKRFLTETSTVIQDAMRISIRFEIREHATPFVGRKQQLEDLHRDLQNNKEILISQIATVTGLGGVGKSELARKYISDHAKEYDNNLIWINAEKYSTLVESFRKLAERLRIKTQDEEGNEKDVRKIVLEVYKYFAEKNRKSLFIFDNAGKFETVDETDEGLDKFLPTGPNKPYVIITSRNQNWSGKIAKIELKVFTESEAVEFITKALIDYPCDEQNMKNLAKKLQYLPLALKQAVAYIKTENERLQKFSSDKFTIQNYLEEYEAFAKNVLKLKVDGYTETVLTTYSVTMHQIKKRHFGKEAEEIMNILAYVSPDNIPARGLFTNLINDSETLSDAAQLLNQYSMANLESGLFNIHRVVQDVIRIQLQQEKKEENVLLTCLRLLSVHIGNIQNRTGGPYTTHAVTAWAYAKKYAELVKLFSRFPAQITDKLEESTRYEEAYLFGSESINVLENVLGPKNPDFLPIMNTIGRVHAKQGQYEKAMNVHQEQSKKSSEILGETHPDTIMAESNITVVMDFQGKYQDALRRHEQIYEKRKKLLGECHYDTLTSRYNIAVEHQKLGDFNSAIKVYKEVLEKYRKLFQEEDHEDILMVKNSMAVALKNLGKYDEALQYYNEVLPGRKRILGEDHPDTLLTMHGIAVVYEAQEKLNEALEAYQEVAEKRRQKFSDEHPDVLGTENNIAGVLLDLGKCQEALELHQKIYNKRRETIGEDHPDTLMSLHNIGLAYEYLEDDDCALAMYQEALAKRKVKLGEDHIETLKTECNIAGIYTAKGNNQGALNVYQRVLPKFEAALGYYHPHTETVRKLLNRATQVLTQDNLKAIYADFDVDLLHIALSLKDVSFVDKYLNDYRSQISNEVNKSKIREIIDKAYLKLMEERDDSGSLEIIITLLLTAIEESAEDCLCRAVNNNCVEIVNYLLENGADPGEKNKENKTALEISLRKLTGDPENELFQTIYAMLISVEK